MFSKIAFWLDHCYSGYANGYFLYSHCGCFLKNSLFCLKQMHDKNYEKLEVKKLHNLCLIYVNKSKATYLL